MLSHSILGLRLERLLKVFGVNARFGALRPGHRRSLCSVHLNELGLGRASGENEEARTFGNQLGVRDWPIA